jgi:hypothetical protein
MARFYQISLRTILEIVFVAAVVFAFVYWRNLPRPAETGRYQIEAMEKGNLIYLDTKTGEMWSGNTTGARWREINTPDRNTGAAGIPSTVVPAPGGGQF